MLLDMSKSFSIYCGSKLLCWSIPEASLPATFAWLEEYCGQRLAYLRAVEEA